MHIFRNKFQNIFNCSEVYFSMLLHDFVVKFLQSVFPNFEF